MIGPRYCLSVNLVISVLFISSNPVHAFIESITVWRSPSGSYVYGCSDAHGFRLKDDGVGSISMKNHASQLAVRDVLARLASEQKKEDFLALVEDSSAYNGSKQSLKEYLQTCAFFSWYGDEDFGSPLIGLMRELEEKSLPAINAEFRFLRTSSDGLMAWLRAKKSLRPPFNLEERRKREDQEAVLYKILSSSGNGIVKEYEEMATEVDNYTDQSLLDYYKSVLHNVRLQAAATIESLRQDREGIIQYIDSHIPAKDQEFFSDSLNWFDSPLLDARVLHHIVTHQGIKKTLVFCGAWHVCQIGMVLEKLLGYINVAHVGVARKYEHPTITFDPSQPLSPSISDLSFLEDKEYELIGSDEPERFSAGSFS